MRKRFKKPFIDGMLIKNCPIKIAKQFNEIKIGKKCETVSVSY